MSRLARELMQYATTARGLEADTASKIAIKKNVILIISRFKIVSTEIPNFKRRRSLPTIEIFTFRITSYTKKTSAKINVFQLLKYSHLE